MSNLKVGRYANPANVGGWQGWIEPDDKSWIAFIAADGSPVVYLNRTSTGAVA